MTRYSWAVPAIAAEKLLSVGRIAGKIVLSAPWRKRRSARKIVMSSQAAIYGFFVGLSVVIAVLAARWARGSVPASFWLEAGAAGLVSLLGFLASQWLHPVFYALLVFLVLGYGRGLAEAVATHPRGGSVLGILFGCWLSFGVIFHRYAG